jgi:hypothetical protein
MGTKYFEKCSLLLEPSQYETGFGWQVVIAMRDLFQVVFELKKKEIEMAKQHIEQHQIKLGGTLFLESGSNSKVSLAKQLMSFVWLEEPCSSDMLLLYVF